MLLQLFKMTFAIYKYQLWKRKTNGKLNSTENLSNCERRKDVLNGSNIASH